ncbi:putative beta-lysine N-acetyltransferase [Acetobacterium woodii]|uniref:Acetyltransferase GNAT family n=1 Tax=Acetobacterium woodii (strain ATCC 29683 / DSM 1030 / JCM 2381 / KCTC 1655 / WB1) TaxID=931626 RepID=H6LHK6_ACEWD|nr:putative beta-lysine N-acetyltransferase [Acetobacterium woodii]AFA47185.1 acetyltransferase GNAT family [Acetobacterium woodii DSM 1030]
MKTKETDTIEKVGDDLIQHGKNSDRIYLMHCTKSDKKQLLHYLNKLGKDQNYSKIIAKVPESLETAFIKDGYCEEAQIPSFYSGEETCKLMGKYLLPERQKVKDKQQIKKVIEHVSARSHINRIKPLADEFEIKRLTEADALEIAFLYKKVFESYPFPIFEPNYLNDTMKDNIKYFGAFFEKQLIAVSSSEMDLDNLNSEMTDFAVLPEFRGHQLAYHLLTKMESEMVKDGFQVLYSIARSASYGMNGCFAKSNYHFGGTLFNNTQISGSIESMNIWYKELK